MTRFAVATIALVCAGTVSAQTVSYIDFEDQAVNTDILSITENGHTWFSYASSSAELPEGDADVPGPDVRSTSAPPTLISGDFSAGFGSLETPGDSFDLSAGDWTVECFVKFFYVGAFQTILGRDKDPLETRTAYADLYFQKNWTDRLVCWYTTGYTDNGDGTFTEERAYVESDALALVEGRWYHVAAVYDGTARTLSVYVNGKLEGQTTDADNITPVTVPSSQVYTIGRGSYADVPGDDYAGWIDDFRITTAALTPSEFLAAQECVADINNDGSADFFDIADFQNGVDAGCN